MANPNKKVVLNKLKIMALGLVTGHTLSTPAQESKDQHAPEDRTTIKAPENREFGIYGEEAVEKAGNEKSSTANFKTYALKEESFKKLEELPYGLFENKAQYVMSCSDWNKNKEVCIKRVDKDQIHNDDLVSVMEAREGRKGDIVNKNSSGSRMFIFQSTPQMGKNFIRYLYCSNNEDLHNFAAKYVSNTPETKNHLESAKKHLYDDKDELKFGLNGTLERQKAIREMSKITVKNIGNGVYSPTFIRDFRELAKKNYDYVLNAQKEFVVGIYPLIDARSNQIANGIENQAQENRCRDGSCVRLGDAGKVVASKIAYGANSGKLLREPKVLAKAKDINEADYITLDAARQMAICGVNGAAEMYETFKQKVDDYKHKMKEYVKEQTTPDLTQKQDAIKNHKEEILMQKQAETSPKNKTFDIGKIIQQKQQTER